MCYLGIFENEQVGLVVALQEFEVQFDRFLATQNLTNGIKYRLRVLRK